MAGSLRESYRSLAARFPWVRRWPVVLKSAIGITLIGVLLAMADPGQLAGHMRRARLAWLPGFIALALAIYAYQGYLLGLIALPFARIPPGRLFAFTMIGRFMSLFLPSVGGDLLKGVYLIPYFANPARAYAAMFVLRALGGLSTLAVALAAGSFLLPEEFRRPVAVATGLFLLGCSVAASGFWLGEDRLRRLASRLRERHASFRVLRMLYTLASAVMAYRHNRGLLLLVFVLSAFANVLAAASYMFLAFILRMPLDFPQALVASSGTMLCVLVPITPGGIGVSEGTFVVLAHLMGVPREHGVAIALVSRLMAYVCSLPGGIFYLLTPLPGIRKSGAAAAAEHSVAEEKG